MKYIQYTYVDAVTGISIATQPAANGPVNPDVKGLEFVWARESAYPTNVPDFFGTCDDDADLFVDGVVKAISESKFGQMRETELTARFNLLRERRLSEVAQRYSNDIAALEKAYSSKERETWPQQVTEARAHEVGALTATPFIDAMLQTRPDDTKTTLVQKIIANYSAYSGVVGEALGRMQINTAYLNSLEQSEQGYTALQEFGAMID